MPKGELTMTHQQPTTTTATWSNAAPIISAEDVAKITQKATLWQKFRLLFKRSRYSYDYSAKDKGCLIRYKKLDGMYFVKETRWL